MNAPPAFVAEPDALPATEAGSGHRPITSKREAIRWLAAELGITGAQAHGLLVAYALDQRDAEARRASREEFRAWFNRRGDLIQVRGKVQHGWAVHS